MNMKMGVLAVCLSGAVMIGWGWALSKETVAMESKSEPTSLLDYFTDQKSCVEIQSLARSVMNTRQSGVSLEELQANEAIPDNLLMNWLLEQAYKQPQYNLPDTRLEIATAFAQYAFTECMIRI